MTFCYVHQPSCFPVLASRGVGGGGVLPHKRLMGMCRWMGPHFHDWIDYNRVAFSIELLERGRTFSDFLGFFQLRDPTRVKHRPEAIHL